MTKELTTKIKELSVRLESAGRWEKSKRSIGEVIKGNKNYIYEFYCLITIISDLSVNHKVEFVKGQGKDPYKFPKGSALKKNSPKFLIKDKNNNVITQVCAGTRVESQYSSPKFHPDISFQKPTAGDKPEFNELIAIMDAKFKKDPNQKLPIDEIHSFTGQLRAFKLDSLKRPHSLNFHNLKPVFGNSILTNGNSFEGDVRILVDGNLKEVSNFYPGKKYKIKG
jgi:hypothetical protein